VIYDYHPRHAPPGVHPKWLSCFPGGAYFGDDNTPEPEEEVIDLVLTDVPHDKSYQDVLAELGF
jgi:hypothetical protein